LQKFEECHRSNGSDLKRCGGLLCGVFIDASQPALAFVWDVLFFQRPTTLVNWLGVMVALAAIYLGMAGQSRSDDSSDGAR
jgi:drug/metabolite transporter (DMT)-like permease